MRRLTVTFLLVLNTSIAFAEDQPDVQTLMNDISHSLLTLLPAVQGGTLNREIFFREVGQLNSLLESAGPHFQQQPAGSLVTYQILKAQLDEVQGYADSLNLFTAKRVLSESFELCASCHKQDQLSRRELGISKFHDFDELTVAEYSYLTRDYESALVSYQNFLAEDQADAYQRIQALNRILSIQLEVRADPKAALKIIKGLQQTSTGHTAETALLNNWQQALERLASGTAHFPALSPMPVAELDQYLNSDWPAIQSMLNHEQQQPYWLLIRHQLNEALNRAQDSSALPMLFYWLAVSDRAMHFQFYDSMSGRYLEQCIRRFPGEPYARKCLDEYELLMIVSFSGSGGINIPPAVSRQINELRRLVHPAR